MPDMQFSELIIGDIFTADGVLYIKTGLSATALTGVDHGQPCSDHLRRPMAWRSRCRQPLYSLPQRDELGNSCV